MKLKDLKDKRAKLISELRGMNEKPAGDDGDLSTEQRSRFDTAKAEIGRIDTQIERAEFIDAADRRAAGEPISGSGDRTFDNELRQFSLRAAIASQVDDSAQGLDFGREREISAELQRRGMRPSRGGIMCPLAVFEQRTEQRVITSALPGGGPGSNLVSTDHLGNQFIDILRARMITRGLGARVLSGLVGNVSIPGLKASGTAEFIAENAALTGGDHEFRSVTMSPKHVGALTEFSRNMLLQTSPDIEALIRSDFADILAQGLDRASIQGGGSNEPTGILETASIGSFDGSTWAGVLGALEDLGVANADFGSLGWAMNAKIQRKLRSTLKVSGDAGAGFIMDSPTELAGYRAAVSNNVPSNLESADSPSTNDNSALIFGNWQDLIVGYWSAVEILVNPFETTAYKKGNVQVRALLTADVAVRHVESFTADTTFVTAA